MKYGQSTRSLQSGYTAWYINSTLLGPSFFRRAFWARSSEAQSYLISSYQVRDVEKLVIAILSVGLKMGCNAAERRPRQNVMSCSAIRNVVLRSGWHWGLIKAFLSSAELFNILHLCHQYFCDEISFKVPAVLLSLRSSHWSEPRGRAWAGYPMAYSHDSPRRLSMVSQNHWKEGKITNTVVQAKFENATFPNLPTALGLNLSNYDFLFNLLAHSAFCGQFHCHC